MALVDYDSDESQTSSGQSANAKRARLDDSDRHTQCPASVRLCTCPKPRPNELKFLPVHGDWPCLVYLTVESTDGLHSLCDVYVRTISAASGVPFSNFSAGDEENFVHVSLSRPFTLRHEQIRPLETALRAAFSSAKPHDLSLCEPAVFINDHGSRSFAAALLSPESSSVVCSWIGLVDGVLRQWDKPKFYKPAVPHASLGDAPGDVQTAVERAGLRVVRADPSQRAPAGYRTAVDQLLAGGQARLPSASAGGGAGAASSHDRVPASDNTICSACGGSTLAAGSSAAAGAGSAAGSSGGQDQSSALASVTDVTATWRVTSIVLRAGHQRHEIWLGPG